MMNFSQLKKLIQEVKKSIPCKECGATYKDKGLRLIGSLWNESFLLAQCLECKNEMIINIVLTQERGHRRLSKNRGTFKPISSNDILDMRNFLKQFNGDFINLFSKKQ